MSFLCETVMDRHDPIDGHDMNMIRWENQRDHDEMEYEPFRKNFYKGSQKFETRLKLKSRRIKRPCRSKK
jgi:hypothetical protein